MKLVSHPFTLRRVDDKSDWQDLALCQQVDPEIFFPEKGGTTKPGKAICKLCEVRKECLALALENDERYGIWGGCSERERRKLKLIVNLP